MNIIKQYQNKVIDFLKYAMSHWLAVSVEIEFDDKHIVYKGWSSTRVDIFSPYEQNFMNTRVQEKQTIVHMFPEEFFDRFQILFELKEMDIDVEPRLKLEVTNPFFTLNISPGMKIYFPENYFEESTSGLNIYGVVEEVKEDKNEFIVKLNEAGINLNSNELITFTFSEFLEECVTRTSRYNNEMFYIVEGDGECQNHNTFCT